jgi:hypothetical protein
MQITRFLLLGLLGLPALMAGRAAYPVQYSGGFYRSIYVTLKLHSDRIYTYHEWTHAGYSVRDSGTYVREQQYLVLTSYKTTHSLRRAYKRRGKKRVPLPARKAARKLFVRTRALVNVDTILIKKRRVLYNRELGYYLAKD